MSGTFPQQINGSGKGANAHCHGGEGGSHNEQGGLSVVTGRYRNQRPLAGHLSSRPNTDLTVVW